MAFQVTFNSFGDIRGLLSISEEERRALDAQLDDINRGALSQIEDDQDEL